MTRDSDARAAWAVMLDLVTDNERRQAVSDAIGLPFSRVRALKRIAPGPITLRELAARMNVDPPNCTAIVDDLERRGLVERQAHPTDRRSKLVVLTAEGVEVAAHAKLVTGAPPAALADLGTADLAQLAALMTKVQHAAG